MAHFESNLSQKPIGGSVTSEDADKEQGGGAKNIGAIEIKNKRLIVDLQEDSSASVKADDVLCHQEIPWKSTPDQDADPVQPHRYKPDQISLPKAGKRVDRTWWKRTFMGTALTGVAVFFATGGPVNPVSWVVGACTLGILVVGGLAWGGRLYQDHKAARHRARQVEEAMQSIERQGIVFSEEQLGRLERLSPEDWEQLLHIPNLNINDDYVYRKQYDLRYNKAELEAEIKYNLATSSFLQSEIRRIERNIGSKDGRNRGLEEEKGALQAQQARQRPCTEEVEKLRAKLKQLETIQLHKPSRDYRTFIRARAIINVATNDAEGAARQIPLEDQRRTPMAGATAIKAQLLEQAKDLTLTENLPLLAGLRFDSDVDSFEARYPIRIPRIDSLQSAGADEKGRGGIEEQESVRGLKAEQVHGAGAKGRPCYVQRQKAEALFYGLFRDMRAPAFKADELPGVEGKAEVEAINRNLKNLIVARSLYSSMLISHAAGKGGPSAQQEAEDRTVSNLAAKVPRRFAKLFETEDAEFNRADVKIRPALNQAMHGILYAMAGRGAAIDELEDAKHVLTTMAKSSSEAKAEQHLRKQMLDALESVARGETVGRATGIHLGYGLEKGRIGWNSLNYEAVRRAKLFNKSDSRAAKVVVPKVFPQHREALLEAGLDGEAAANVIHWAGPALDKFAPLPKDSEAAGRIRRALRLRDYARISAEYGHLHLPNEKLGLPDQRRDLIRAILYVIAAADPAMVELAKGGNRLEPLASELCKCSVAQLQSLFKVVFEEKQDPSKLYDATHRVLSEIMQKESQGQWQYRNKLLLSWQLQSQTDRVSALAYGPAYK